MFWDKKEKKEEEVVEETIEEEVTEETTEEVVKEVKKPSKPKCNTEVVKKGSFVVCDGVKCLHTKDGKLVQFKEKNLARRTVKYVGGKVIERNKYFIIKK